MDQILLVNSLQQNDKSTKFAQIAKQIPVIVKKITPLTIKLLVNLLQRDDKST